MTLLITWIYIFIVHTKLSVGTRNQIHPEKNIQVEMVKIERPARSCQLTEMYIFWLASFVGLDFS